MKGNAGAEKTALILFQNHVTGEETDLEVPLDLTAEELLRSLITAFRLAEAFPQPGSGYLKAEDPFVLLRGNRTLKEAGVRNGTVIHFTGETE